MVLEAFDHLRALREQMALENGVSEYGEGLQLQELVVFNVADWTSEEISQLCRDAAASAPTDGTIEIITNTLPIGKNIILVMLFQKCNDINTDYVFNFTQTNVL